MQSVLDTLKYFEVDLVVCGGYMKIIGPETVKEFKNRIINIHVFYYFILSYPYITLAYPYNML